ACLGAGGYRVMLGRHLPSAAAPAEAEPEKVRAS
ncbi:aquaporin, partial [Pseudomonas aeruginosa]